MSLVMDAGPAREVLLERPAVHVHRHEVRFQEIDAAGIVFFPRLFELLHDAYAGFLAAHGCPLPEVLREGRWAAPIRHAEAEFLRPLRFGDQVEVGVVAATLRESDYTLGYRVVHEGRAAVLGRTLHVVVDRQTFRRTALPPELAAALERLR